jgi:hypothetical protein
LKKRIEFTCCSVHIHIIAIPFRGRLLLVVVMEEGSLSPIWHLASPVDHLTDRLSRNFVGEASPNCGRGDLQVCWDWRIPQHAMCVPV